MAKTRGEKKAIIDKMTTKIKDSKSFVFVKFDGLGVAENEALRNELREQGGEYLATKKTLLKKSLENNSIDNIETKNFEGQIATLFGYEDEVAPAKVAAKFIKDNEEKMEFVGGVLEGKFIDPAGVTALAKLPSKEELYAKIVGSLNAPVSGFVNVLAGNIRGLVNVLKAIEEKKA